MDISKVTIGGTDYPISKDVFYITYDTTEGILHDGNKLLWSDLAAAITAGKTIVAFFNVGDIQVQTAAMYVADNGDIVAFTAKVFASETAVMLMCFTMSEDDDGYAQAIGMSSGSITITPDD